jgi:hypothetical protein
LRDHSIVWWVSLPRLTTKGTKVHEVKLLKLKTFVNFVSFVVNL